MKKVFGKTLFVLCAKKLNWNLTKQARTVQSWSMQFLVASGRYQFEAPIQRHKEIKVGAPSLITSRTTT